MDDDQSWSCVLQTSEGCELTQTLHGATIRKSMNQGCPIPAVTTASEVLKVLSMSQLLSR